MTKGNDFGVTAILVIKKTDKKSFLLANKVFALVLEFKKHSIRLTLSSERGVVV